ncbi:MAG TPA: FGGY family carbohydrate kinase, partial [Capsulimonadaceae bacterium]|nr:FGGY family carbohydrate kinase [Capsulimonadaceae bacterium]
MNKDQALILSLDIGTSSTRALLYDSQGRALKDAEVQIAYNQTTTPDGGVETDAAALYDRTIEAIR